MIYEITELKELTGDQYDRCKMRAVERVQRQIGDKPVRKRYKREYAPLWGILDMLAVIIFLAALAISSVHILAYSGAEAQTSFDTAMTGVLGLQVGQNAYGVVHQVAFIFLAEAAMLLFFVMFRTRATWDRWVSLILAIMAVSFVVVANLSSGLNVFLSLLAPVFTIGIGFRLEAIIAEGLRRNEDVDSRYRAALEVWEVASHDATEHPHYQTMLFQELWEKLVSFKANRAYTDAPNGFKIAAVRREMQRDTWALDMSDQGADMRQFTTVVTPASGPVEVAPDVPLAPNAMRTITSQATGNGHAASENGEHSS